MATEILVELIPDFTKLESAIDQMVSSGAISKEIGEAFKKAQKPIDDLSKKIKSSAISTKKDLDTMKKSVDGVTKSFAEGFKQGVQEELKRAGVTIDEFENKLKETTTSSQSLKSRLKEITQELALMKAEGKDNTEQYEQLVQQAGQYRDALGDVSAEINKVASDTQKIDTAIEVFQGLAASYQLAVGVLGLLGEETEDYQAALLKINQVMAISMSLQQLGNLLQKESNAIRLITNLQLKAQVAATNLQTAAQSKNIIVSTAATGAMKVLNAVMKANPAFLLVSAFALLAGAFALFTGNANKSKDAVERYNAELERLEKNLADVRDLINQVGSIELKQMELAGKKQSEITGKRISLLKQEQDRVREAANLLEKEQDKILADEDLKHKDKIAKFNEARDKEMAARMEVSKLNTQITLEEIQQRMDVRDENKAAAEEQKKLTEEAIEEERKARTKGFEDFIALQERKLLLIDKGGLEELDLRKRLLNAELQLALDNAELTENQRKLLIAKFFAERKKMDDDYYKGQVKLSMENQLAILNAELSGLNVSAKAREELIEKQLNIQRELELAQVTNNEAKRKEINAKFDKEIAEQRLAIRKDGFEKELALEQALQGQRRRALQATSEDVTKDIDLRKDAVDELTEIEIDALQKRKAELDKNFADNLISQKDYNLESAIIKDAELAAYESAEKKKTDITKQGKELRLKEWKEEVKSVIDILKGIGEILSSITGAITDAENARIDEMRGNLENMREMNMITQKEFEQRSKQIEAAERIAKRKQAEREKALALFNALVQGAQAIVEAAPNPLLIALTSAIVAAQIGAIIARPIPKFGSGTKAAPKGFAHVAETGTEIIKTDKGYYMAEQPQIIWMKGGERIYNPKETETIMKSVIPSADGKLITNSSVTNYGNDIDYNKMAKAVGDEIAKHPRNIINLDEDGFTLHQISKLSKEKYLNKRYTFHD